MDMQLAFDLHADKAGPSMPASFTLSILVAILAAVGGYIYITVQQNTPRDDYQPLQLPGPVLLGAVDGVNLDGLTLVRTVRLPAIKVKLPGIGELKIRNQTSELVFDRLRVTDVRVRAADAASGAVHTAAKASLDFQGTVLVTIEFALDLSWLGLGKRILKRQTSGRISAAIQDLVVALPLQVGKTKEGNPVLHNHGLVFCSGSFTRLEFTGAPAAHIAAKLPLWITMAPISNFLLSDCLRSKEVTEMLANVWNGIKPFLDPTSWQEITIERQLPTPKPSQFPDKLQTSFSIVGPTNFTNIVLPDHSPKLYREKGKLAYMQSWNKLTSEVKFDITKNKIERLGFTKVALEWLTESPTTVHANDMADVITEAPINSDTYTMICRIEGLFAEVSSSFAVYADMGKVLQLVTNQRQLGEKGDSKAQARAARFELVFQVIVEETGVTVKTIRVDDLDHIDVTISGLRTRANDLVNSALKFVKPQIATVAGSLVRNFLEQQVKQSTKAFETVEEALLLRGVEAPGIFRKRPRDQQKSSLLSKHNRAAEGKKTEEAKPKLATI